MRERRQKPLTCPRQKGAATASAWQVISAKLHCVVTATLCNVLLMLCPPAVAANFLCITSASGFQQALDVAANNGQHDFIQLHTGLYTADALGQPFTYAPQENADLTITGGYETLTGVPGCINTASAYATELNGSGVRPVLIVRGAGHSGALTIRNLAISNGFDAVIDIVGEHGAGIGFHGSPSFAGDVAIDRVAFVGNRALGYDGALFLRTVGGAVTIRNSLFYLNRAGVDWGAGNLFVDGADPAQFINNTVVLNQCLDGAPLACNGGLAIRGSAHWNVSNSVLYFNTDSDLTALADYELHATPIEDIAGNFPSSGAFMFIDSPGFVGPTNFRLRPDSPLLNTGTVITDLGSRDLDAQPRVSGTSVDVGAYELEDGLFADDFESL